MSNFLEWLRDTTLLEKMIAGTVVLLVVVLVVGIPARMREKEAFMSACTQDHKDYECQVMWKQLHPDPQQVIVYH